MCPLCMANAVLLVGSATSGGGVIAVVVSKILRRKRKQRTKEEQNENNRLGIRSRSGVTAGMGECASAASREGEGVDESPGRVGRGASADAVAGCGEEVRIRRTRWQGELARS